MSMVFKKHMKLLNAGLLTCVIVVFGMGLVSATHTISPAKKPQPSPKVPQPNQLAQLKLNQNYGHIPLYFEPNEGQTDPQVKYISRGSGYSLFLTPAEAVFGLKRAEPNPSKFLTPNSSFPIPHSRRQIPNSKFLIPSTAVLRLRLENGNRL